MLAISFSIDTKILSNKLKWVFFFAKLGLAGLLFPLDCGIWLFNNLLQSRKSLMAHYFKEPSFVNHIIVKKEEKNKDYPLTFLLIFSFK